MLLELGEINTIVGKKTEQTYSLNASVVFSQHIYLQVLKKGR